MNPEIIRILSLPKVKARVNKVMGELGGDDKIYCHKNQCELLIYDCQYCHDDLDQCFIIIPPVYSSDGRCLVKCLDREPEMHYNFYMRQWVVKLFNKLIVKKYDTSAETLDLALLKAIEWEVEHE